MGADFFPPSVQVPFIAAEVITGEIRYALPPSRVLRVHTRGSECYGADEMLPLSLSLSLSLSLQ